MKHIIFDLDETIGAFYECSIIYEAIMFSTRKKLKNVEIFEILDLFPETFRPGIFDILNYLTEQKDIEINLYTNNPYKMWVYMIKAYIEEKLGKKIFKHVIYGWKKFDGSPADKRRTTNAKTLTEYNRIIENKKHLKMLFLDDSLHARMTGANMTYFHLKPHKMGKGIDKIISEYLSSPICKIEKTNKVKFITYILQNYIPDTPENEDENTIFFMKGSMMTNEILPGIKIFLSN